MLTWWKLSLVAPMTTLLHTRAQNILILSHSFPNRYSITFFEFDFNRKRKSYNTSVQTNALYGVAFDLFLPPTSLLYFLHSLSTPHPWLLPGNQPTALITLSLLHLSSAHTNGFCRHASLMLLWRNMWGKKKVLCWISKLNTTYCKTITTTFFLLKRPQSTSQRPKKW